MQMLRRTRRIRRSAAGTVCLAPPPASEPSHQLSGIFAQLSFFAKISTCFFSTFSPVIGQTPPWARVLAMTAIVSQVTWATTSFFKHVNLWGLVWISDFVTIYLHAAALVPHVQTVLEVGTLRETFVLLGAQSTRGYYCACRTHKGYLQHINV